MDLSQHHPTSIFPYYFSIYFLCNWGPSITRAEVQQVLSTAFGQDSESTLGIPDQLLNKLTTHNLSIKNTIVFRLDYLIIHTQSSLSYIIIISNGENASMIQFLMRLRVWKDQHTNNFGSRVCNERLPGKITTPQIWLTQNQLHDVCLCKCQKLPPLLSHPSTTGCLSGAARSGDPHSSLVAFRLTDSLAQESKIFHVLRKIHVVSVPLLGVPLLDHCSRHRALAKLSPNNAMKQDFWCCEGVTVGRCFWGERCNSWFTFRSFFGSWTCWKLKVFSTHMQKTWSHDCLGPQKHTKTIP